MSLQPASVPLEAFLPAADQPLTLEALLHGYGKWWQSQTSLTQYPRQYNTDNEHYLIVWEGNPGFYDFYGDFEDDNHFYNHVVKGNMIHFHIRIVDHKTKHVEVSVSRNFRVVYERHYHTLDDMRTGMIDEWVDITPDLGEGGQGLRRFMAQYADPTLGLLKKSGQTWVEAGSDDARHFLVYQSDIFLYLCLWIGSPDAVTPTNGAAQESKPIIDWSRLLLYAEVRVSFMRVPIRFDLHQRRWHSTPDNTGHYVDLTQSDVATLRNFEALETKLTEVMKNLDFITPAG